MIPVSEQSLEMWTERGKAEQQLFASASSGAISEPPGNKNEPLPFPTRPRCRLGPDVQIGGPFALASQSRISFTAAEEFM